MSRQMQQKKEVQAKPMPQKSKTTVKLWVRVVAIGCAVLIAGSGLSALIFFL